MNQITRKRKPLGPRQRAAYAKPFRAALEAAKAKVAAQLAAVATAEKRLAHLGVPAIIVRANEPRQPALVSTLELDTWGIKVSTPAEVRASRKALLEGESGVNINGGSPKLPSLLRRIRRMATPDVKKLRSLDRRIAALNSERATLIATAFERGVAWTPEQMATLILDIKKAKLARPSWINSHAVTRAEHELEEAQKHDGTATCPCSPCEWARKYAAADKQRKVEAVKREKAEARRLAKLGTVTFTCPEDRDGCGQVNEHVQVDEDEDYRDGRYVAIKIVECGECEMTWPLDEVTVPPAPGQQELVAA